MSDYEKSDLYRAGQFHKELGELLMNPKTDTNQLADFGFKYDMHFSFKFTPKEIERPATQEGGEK